MSGCDVYRIAFYALIVGYAPSAIAFTLHHMALVKDYRAVCAERDQLLKQLGKCSNGGTCPPAA